MKKGFLLLMVLLWTVFYGPWTKCGTSMAEASVPHLINYQGKLTNASGQPLNGAYNVTFRFYDAETAGNLLWQETHSGVIVEKGLFSVLLGSVASLGVPFDRPYFLEIKVGEEVMTPRQRITSAGYALRAEKAEDAEKFAARPASDYVLASDVTSIPTANKAVKLDANAKLPVSALKFYDSGWFAVSASTLYTKTHNLGTTRILISVYCSNSSIGATKSTLIGFWREPPGTGGCITDITSNTVTLKAGEYPFAYMNVSDVTKTTASCYYRLVILALE